MSAPPEGPASPAPPGGSGRRGLLALLVLGTLLRLALGASLGLGVDESYAVAVARPAAWGYFDHPPLVFWLAGAASALGGWSPLALRLPFVALFAGTTWLLFELGAALFGPRAGLWTAAALTVAPVLSVATGGWVLPDGPLDLALAAGALCAARATGVVRPNDVRPDGVRPDGVRAVGVRWWLAAGVCAGVALLSKYHGAFLLLGTFAFIVTAPPRRRWLRHPAPWGAAAIALACFAPVVAWNARHGWASFAFQGGRSGRWTGLHLAPVLQSLAGQALWLGPWVWVPLAVAVAAALRRGPREERGWLLCCLGLGPVLVFTLAALGGRPGLPHWQAPGYLLLLPLLGASLAAAERVGRRWPRRWLGASAAVLVLVAALVASDVRTGWVQRAYPAAFARGDPSVQGLDWTPLRAALDAPAARGRVAFVAVPSWVVGGKAGYALRGALPVVCVCGEPHEFAFREDDAALAGRDAYVVTDVGGAPPPELAAAFDALEPLPDVSVVRGGRAALVLHPYLGRRYRGPSAAGGAPVSSGPHGR